MQLTPHQQDAFDRLRQFCLSPSPGVAILKGYAGTGKTTLTGALVRALTDAGATPILLASTGRAAKILQDKAGFPARTVHSCIYAFEGLAGMPEATPAPGDGRQLSLNFGLRTPDSDLPNPVFIVDEASMISHEVTESRTNTARFGTGSLLDDLMQYTRTATVVFVGDPCQLPPVADSDLSPALDEAFLRNRYQRNTLTVELSEIIRQQTGSEILELAGRFRKAITQGVFPKWVKLGQPAGRQAHILHTEQALVRAYFDAIQRGNGYHESIMITSSNKLCHRLNNEFRTMRHGQTELQAGELLMVVQNSYRLPFVNGDQVMVVGVRGQQRQAGFTFLVVQVQALHSPDVYETLLIRELLYSEQPMLSRAEQERLIIDFDTRVRSTGVGRNSTEYINAMQTDAYLNALRVKFGYALTCHKAQGGEWPNVYLNIHSSLYGAHRDKHSALCRWYYTALTRARMNLYVNHDWWVGTW